MRCVNCLGQFMTIQGDLKLTDKFLGDVFVKNAEWEQCNGCGEILYSPETLQAIETAEEHRKKELLLKRPLEEFITATEASKILDCTRQAVHKHKRIRRGFIHFVKHNGKIQYLKESVELYKETGDGRINIAPQKVKQISSPKKEWSIIVIPVPVSTNFITSSKEMTSFDIASNQIGYIENA